MKLRHKHKGIHINKSSYLVILYILFLNGMNFIPIAIIGSDALLILIFCFLFWGKYVYRKDRILIFPKTYYRCINWIFVGIFISMLSAYWYYNQSIFQSLITYRTQYLMVTPLFLAKMGLTRDDVISSLYKFTWVFASFYVLRTAIPGLFILPEIIIDDTISLPGYVLLTIPLYYTLQQLSEKITTQRILYIIFVIGLIFCQENRSTLFPVLILSAWMFMKIKSRNKIPFIIFISLIALVVLIQVWDTIQALIDQTQAELNNPKYNRNKAFIYFIEVFSPNLWCTIFGNGFLSSHSVPIMALLMKRGIYNSDLGFIGYWNQFGLIPIIVFLYLYLSAILKKTPLFIKSIAIQTLVCCLTISYFGNSGSIIFFSLFYYLYFITSAKYIKKKKLFLS